MFCQLPAWNNHPSRCLFKDSLIKGTESKTTVKLRKNRVFCQLRHRGIDGIVGSRLNQAEQSSEFAPHNQCSPLHFAMLILTVCTARRSNLSTTGRNLIRAFAPEMD
jgi:hypothetical protein